MDESMTGGGRETRRLTYRELRDEQGSSDPLLLLLVLLLLAVRFVEALRLL